MQTRLNSPIHCTSMRHGKTINKLEGVFNKKFNENGAVYEKQTTQPYAKTVRELDRRADKEVWSIPGQNLVSFLCRAEGGQNESGF